ncbi:thioredoxin family protein [Klebsiella pneumoniae]
MYCRRAGIRDSCTRRFLGPWCNPCRTVAPIIDALALEHAGKLKVYKVNVDKHPDLASQHGIRTIPFLRSL